jgi:hypothetical protein
MWNIVLIVIVVFNVMFAVDSYYTAYDEYVGFNVCGNRLNYKNDYSLINNNNIDLALSVENGGIISAFALLKGAFHTITQYKQLPRTSTEMILCSSLNLCVKARKKETERQ